MDNITENNKIIAEFLDWEFDDLSETFETPFLKLVEPQAFGDEQFSCKLQDFELDFHTDWNWLMPVVEKIESLNLGNTTIKTVFSEEDLYINSNVSFLIMYKECYVNFFGEMKVYENWISVTECNSKIEAVYNACVEFIKWYNKQNKNNESL